MSRNTALIEEEVVNDPAPHSIELDTLIQQGGVKVEMGLSDQQVIRRRQKYGENILRRQKPKSSWYILLDQLSDPIICVLAVATLLAFLFQDWLEGIAILVVIIITAAIGYFMERQALKSMEALFKLSQARTRVRRNGKISNLTSEELVPGDIVLLEAGDMVPADCRLLTGHNLGVKEAALTGESGQIDKWPSTLPAAALVSDQTNMVFSGTMVSRGTAEVLVISTGDRTELGKIGALSRASTPESTPLEKKLTQLSRRLIWLTIVLALIIATVGFLSGKDLWLMLEIGIALAIAAIPEGLPIVATIALARGMLRLAEQRVLIKKLESVEALGELGIILTDKTGTLTENQMDVKAIILGEEDQVTWPFAESDLMANHQGWEALLRAAILCNNASLDEEEHVGDPLETALLQMAADSGYSIDKIRTQYLRIDELPFDAESRFMTTIHEEEGHYLVTIKGALEAILPHCTHFLSATTQVAITDPDTFQQRADQLAAEGLRTLAFAQKSCAKPPSPTEVLHELEFLGLVGFLDPPRSDVSQAIQTYHKAGIRVVMVTGDHLQTAKKIAQEVGILKASNDDTAGILSGDILPHDGILTPNDKDRVLKAQIFARVVPAQKLWIVKTFQEANWIVGMTGDGVNDTPALKKADIGIAMGMRGTEAAKEAADVILKDDRFASIELAIAQGRNIFENIRRFVVYLMSSNLAEIITVAIAALSNLPMPLLPLQILFLNFVTDIFPALAIGMSLGEKDLMNQKPRSTQEPILTQQHWLAILIYGLSIALSVIGVTVYTDRLLGYSSAEVNTVAFCTLVMGQLLNVFNLTPSRYSFIDNTISRNLWIWGALFLSAFITAAAFFIPTLQKVLSLATFDFEYLWPIGIFSVAALALAQIIKRGWFLMLINQEYHQYV